MAHDLFISYAAENKPVADAVCAFLEARSIRCWIAPRDILPGAHYGSSIIDAISASRIFLLVFSASANQSPQVMREVERAVAKGLPILPFRIEDVPLSPDMEYFISAPHWLDALTQPLEGHLAHLAETAQLLLSRMGAAPSDLGRSHGEPARDRTTVSPGREEVREGRRRAGA
jgi:TIR domain